MVKALAKHGKDEEIQEGENKPEERKPLLTLKQAEALYLAVERPVDDKALGTVPEEEWAFSRKRCANTSPTNLARSTIPAENSRR